MVNVYSQLEDDDLEGSNIGDSPSESELEPGQRTREEVLRTIFSFPQLVQHPGISPIHTLVSTVRSIKL